MMPPVTLSRLVAGKAMRTVPYPVRPPGIRRRLAVTRGTPCPACCPHARPACHVLAEGAARGPAE